ncbi:hypothetical protein A9Q74_03985 [Colwellia sp. 39_35_sub15_T18]|nr:hypothetical protein A9Q74_03985 [Colwellia sp. 39_35_sub15_T18]
MLNKLVLRALLSLSLAFTFLGTANAALITQDIISDSLGVIGSITIDTVAVDEFDSVNDWVSFDFFGYEAEESFLFSAIIDTSDFYAGILSLDFDVNDLCFSCEWAYNGFIEAGFGGAVDIFDPANGDFIFFTDDLSFGQASVVPEPSALILLLTGLIAFAVRRKVS